MLSETAYDERRRRTNFRNYEEIAKELEKDDTRYFEPFCIMCFGSFIGDISRLFLRNIDE